MPITKEEIVARILADMVAVNEGRGYPALDASKRLLRLCAELTMETVGDAILAMPDEETAMHVASSIAASHALLWADGNILTPAGSALIQALAKAAHGMPEDLLDLYYGTVQQAVEQIPGAIVQSMKDELQKEGEEA